MIQEDGSYITVNAGRLDRIDYSDEISSSLAKYLRSLLTPYLGGTLCIVGAGNQLNIADSIGPETVRRFPASMMERIAKRAVFNKIVTIIPNIGVITNLELAPAISSIASAAKADCVLLIDSTACDAYYQLCSEFQLSNIGLTGHYRKARLDYREIKFPVVSISFPTCIPIRLLNNNEDDADTTYLTLENIHMAVKNAAYTIAQALIEVTYPEFNWSYRNQIISSNLLW